MTELTDQQILERAQHAKRILDDELFNEACLSTRQGIIDAWEMEATSEGREKLHYRLMGLTSVVQTLRGFMEHGDFLKGQLERKERHEQ